MTDKRGVDLISDALPFGRLWYDRANAVVNAIGYAQHRSRSYNALIRVFDSADNVIETLEHAGEFKGAFTFAPENAAPKVTTALPPMRDR
jgi:hypothetical protein